MGAHFLVVVGILLTFISFKFKLLTWTEWRLALAGMLHVSGSPFPIKDWLALGATILFCWIDPCCQLAGGGGSRLIA